MSSLPITSNIFKAAGGLAQQRDVPRFATQTFKKWHKKRPATGAQDKKVLLWADTFSNHFMPEIARDATHVLESLGFQTLVPSTHLCCGRPLYDFGMLDKAKDYLLKIMKQLKSEIDAGIPVVGLEPSCLAVFKDELINLFPKDKTARRLSDSVQSFAQFMIDEGLDSRLPNLSRKVIVHGHCQQKALIGLKSEIELLKKMNVDFEVLDSGCCGMAGSFGFEKGKYDISSKIGELVLLPRVRSAKEDTLILADGFSYREQIQQKTGRKAMHIAQLVAFAVGEKPDAMFKASCASSHHLEQKRKE